MTLNGTCPECEFEFTAADVERGETLVCPECALTLQIVAVEGATLAVEVVQTTLPDWGE